MKSHELLALGLDEHLSGRITQWAHDHGVWFRSLQHVSALFNLLQKGSRGTVLIAFGRDLAGEVKCLMDVTRQYGELNVIAYGDIDQPHLEGIVYDLGATAVVFSPRTVDELFEVLEFRL